VTAATNDRPVAIIGGGPAGLTAAYELSRKGVPCILLEQDGMVGGLARTVEYKGFRFDLGGHRFFTKAAVVNGLWRSMLGDEYLRRPRLSRIYYRGRFFHYPLRPLNIVLNLGPLTMASVLASYVWAKIRPVRPERSFADWVSNRFGRRLYRIFFKTYTEKVWGIPCERISSQWAAQRIRGLSIRTALLDMLKVGNGPTVKTLIQEFEYPRLGPGQMWEAFRTRIEAQGGRVDLNSRVTGVRHDGRRVGAIEIERDGVRRTQPVAHVLSSMPLRELVAAFEPAAPPTVREAASRLQYRDFLTVALIVGEPRLFDDNWIYIHDDRVRVGRIQNFKNWSPAMVPDPGKTCLGLEYFCNQGDDLWTMADADLVRLATREVESIGLVRPGTVEDGTVVRNEKAYPVYDDGYAEAIDRVVPYLRTFENLQPVGRNGMHKYNNQDHSMLTALLAVGNLDGAGHDIWAVNSDSEYLEESADDGTVTLDDLRRVEPTQPAVPRAIEPSD
jgi:protoporphyrinogen oxidase